jgi:hypothetical protein
MSHMWKCDRGCGRTEDVERTRIDVESVDDIDEET